MTEEAYAGTDSFYPTSLEVTDVRGTATSSSPAPGHGDLLEAIAGPAVD